MSVGLMKTLIHGRDFTFHSPADVIHLYDKWRSEIFADAFNPLAPFMGGISAVMGHNEGNRSLQALLCGQDWLDLCRLDGAGTKNAVLCLASNFDDQKGIVALALELGMIATKPRTAPDIKIDVAVFSEIFHEIFLKDYAGILSMSEKWGVGIREGLEVAPKRTRSTWRQKLGYDVLIHPCSLEPCKGKDGGFALEYRGTTIMGEGEESSRAYFEFTSRDTGEKIKFPNFPPLFA